MTHEKIDELILMISTQLATLNTQTKSVLDKLAEHETRLAHLEFGKSSLKDTVVTWLVKGIVVALVTIGGLTGASGLLVKVFGFGG